MRVDSVPFMYTWLAAAWPDSWRATARVSSSGYSMLTAVPDSTVVIASRMSPRVEALAAVGMRVRERHRADLLEHRRAVAARDARELVRRFVLVELPSCATFPM